VTLFRFTEQAENGNAESLPAKSARICLTAAGGLDKLEALFGFVEIGQWNAEREQGP
jgi:hypothetical protein